MKRTNKKGFTLVELVIVIAVIAILATVLIPTFSSIIRKANTSADIQAARNMNTHLAVANVTDGVNSILDVYGLFEDSGYSVERYKPLTEGTQYFYDKQYNQILYVDEATGKVLFPDEHKDETQGTHDWYSLSMDIAATKPASYTELSATNKTVAATVTTGEELKYVLDDIAANSTTEGLNGTITLSGTVDMKGAYVAVDKIKKANITIQSSTPGTPAVIKNLTSDKTTFEVHIGQGMDGTYNSAILFANIENSNVTIKDVVFENLSVKALDGSNVALICGQLYGSSTLELDNVTIRNSTVIGARNVGAIVGILTNSGAANNTTTKLTFKGNVILDNVSVQTVQGRSGLLVGMIGGGTDANKPRVIELASGATLDYSTSKYEMYGSNWEAYTPTSGQNATHHSTDPNDASHRYYYNANSLVAISNNGAYSVINEADFFKTY